MDAQHKQSKFEDLKYIYVICAYITEKEDNIRIDPIEFIRLTVQDIRAYEMEKTIQNLNSNEQSFDPKKYTRMIEHKWISTLQASKIHNSSKILVAHSNREFDLEGLKMTINGLRKEQTMELIVS